MNKIKIIVGILLLSMSLHANAVLTIDQNQPITSSIMAGFDQSDLAQSFQQTAGNIGGAGIFLNATGTSDVITISLYDNLPTLGGTLLASASGTATAGTWFDVSWALVSVTPGTTLYLVFSGVNNTLAIDGDTNNPYPLGQVYANLGFGSFPSYDYTFRTYFGVPVAPDAPNIGTAIPGNTQASVSFTAPASDGGSSITGYTVTSSPAGGVDSNAGTTGLNHTITGLVNGTPYTFTVTATNIVGTSAVSAASNSVTPAITIPDAPTDATATGSNAQALVSFTAPASDGGSAITSYTVTSSPEGLTASAATGPITVTGLTAGVTYTFTVTATNSIGTSSASVASNSISLGSVPDAPTDATATGGNGQALVSFTAPANDGGSEITSYTVTSSPEGLTASAATGPITVTGLSDGVTYTFTVTATNIIGTSAASAASNSISLGGGGGGSTNPIWLLMLALVPLLRRKVGVNKNKH